MKVVVLGSGSEGNSTFIEINNVKILIDVGFNYKQLKKKLEEIEIDIKDIQYLFITHEHTDHIRGLSVFLHNVKPILCLTKKLTHVLFPDEMYDKVILLEKINIIKDIKINVLPLSHDAIDPIGLMFEYSIESLVYITDTGYINTKIIDIAKNKNYYIIESNHDPEKLINGPYPPYLQKRILSDVGHLSNKMCGVYLSKLIGKNTKKVILAHLSKTNNTEEIALNTVKKVLIENKILFYNIECANEESFVKINNS